MKFPSFVEIGATTYAVQLTEEPLLLDHRECTGLIEYNDQRIFVSATLAEDRRWMTLWHEIFHGFVEDRGLTLDSELEEQIVEAFARSMHQFLRDNPGMFYEDILIKAEFSGAMCQGPHGDPVGEPGPAGVI